jgi:hypothetical protein
LGSKTRWGRGGGISHPLAFARGVKGGAFAQPLGLGTGATVSVVGLKPKSAADPIPHWGKTIKIR